MRLSLYHPIDGYYLHNVNNVGRTGDFTTAPEVETILAEAIAEFTKTHAAVLTIHEQSRNREFSPSYSQAGITLVELGPGSGSLAEQICRRFNQTDLLTAYKLVEISPGLTRCQKERLTKLDSSQPEFSHHTELHEALEESVTSAIVFGNEFVDAFPAVQLVYTESGWAEIWVNASSDPPTETIKPLRKRFDAEVPSRPRIGQRVFCQPSFHDWLIANTRHPRLTTLLFFDYGRRAPAQQLRAFEKHQRFTDIDALREPGRRDLTVDVNFNDIRRWAQNLGFAATFDGLLCEFLEQYTRTSRNPSGPRKRLLDPFDAGGAFRALALSRTPPPQAS